LQQNHNHKKHIFPIGTIGKIDQMKQKSVNHIGKNIVDKSLQQKPEYESPLTHLKKMPASQVVPIGHFDQM
jgi:hypothetical protein